MKRLLLLLALFLPAVASAAPSFIFQPSLIPHTDSLYTLGTTTKAWLNIYTDELCLNGDCKTAWPVGGSGGAWPFTPSTNYNVNTQSTSTALALTAGIFASSTSHFVNADFINSTTTGNLYIGSLSGVLKASSGLVSVATGGTDYENPLTFTYPLSRSSNTISLSFGTTTNNIWSGTNVFNGNVTFTQATTTSFFATTASTTRLFVNNASSSLFSANTICFTADTCRTSWPAASPGGSDTYLQFNDGGSFGGNSALRYDKVGAILTIATTSATTTLSTYPDYFSISGTSTYPSYQFGIQPGIVSFAAFTGESGPFLSYEASVTSAYGEISDGTNLLSLQAASTSTFPFGVSLFAINQTGAATSTFARGINLAGGCFSINGTCIAGENALTFNYPLTRSVNTISFSGLSTSSTPTAGNLAYWTAHNTLGTVATNTVTCSTGVNCTSFTAISSGAINIQNSGVTALTASAPITVSANTGNITVGTSFSTSSINIFSALNRFTNASSTHLSVFNNAYFGATATSSFSSAGTLTLASALAFGSGGTGATSFTNTGVIYSGASALSSEAAFTYTAAQDKLTVLHASTTATGVTGSLYLPTSLFDTTRIGLGSTTPSTFWGISIGTSTVGMRTQIAFAIASSTTAAATETVNWDNGNTARYILDENTTFVINSTSSYPRDGGKYTLILCQDNTGSRSATFATPGSLVWMAGGTTSISSAANTATMIGMVYDGRVSRYNVVASSTSSDVRACRP